MVARCDLVEQNQVGAEHDCVAVVEAEDVLDLLAVAAGDALQVAGVVLHQPAADATALPADQVNQRVVAEITLHADHAARQQRRAALEIGRAHVRTPVTNAHLVRRLWLENTKKYTLINNSHTIIN